MNSHRVRLASVWWSRFYPFVLACFLIAACGSASAQNWKKVHRADEEKWAKTTGLDPSVIHKMWKMASSADDERDDNSRIANVDLEGLADRHDALFATYAGEKNCLTITVFRQFSPTQFKKEWSVQQSPDGTGFCDTDFGSAAVDATNGIIAVSVPRSRKDGNAIYTVYAYDWNGITYRFAGQKEVQGR
jgi:hypothetical protein